MWWRCTGKDGGDLDWGTRPPLSVVSPVAVTDRKGERVFRELSLVLPVLLLSVTAGSSDPARILAPILQNLLLQNWSGWLASIPFLKRDKKKKSKTSSCWPLWCHVHHRQCSSCFHVIVTLTTSWRWDSQGNSKSKRRYRETYSWMVLLCKLGKPLQNHSVSVVRHIWPSASSFPASFVSSP